MSWPSTPRRRRKRYVAHDKPAARAGPDILAIASAIDFRPGGSFDPASSFREFSRAWAEARASDTAYDVTAVYVKVAQALGRGNPADPA